MTDQEPLQLYEQHGLDTLVLYCYQEYSTIPTYRAYVASVEGDACPYEVQHPFRGFKGGFTKTQACFCSHNSGLCRTSKAAQLDEISVNMWVNAIDHTTVSSPMLTPSVCKDRPLIHVAHAVRSIEWLCKWPGDMGTPPPPAYTPAY